MLDRKKCAMCVKLYQKKVNEIFYDIIVPIHIMM